MTNKFTYIIVEDELPSIECLKELIKILYPEASLLNVAQNYDAAINLIDCNSPDLIFMDINLGDHTAFEILDKVKITNPNLHVIFITAYEEFALKAFKYDVLDYLLKPIIISELKSTIDKIIENQVYKNKQHAIGKNNSIIQNENTIEIKKEKIIINKRKGFHIIDLNNIVYIEAAGSYSIIHKYIGDSIYVSKNLKYISSLIETNNLFIRVQKSYIINKKFVHSFDSISGNIIMLNNSKVPISLPYKELLNIIY